MRRLFKRAIDRVAGFYKLYQVYIYSILDKYKLTEKQIDFISSRLELLGGAAVAQFVVFPLKAEWLSILVCIASLGFCATIWLTTFIMKGHKK